MNIHDLLAPWRGSAVFAAAAAFAAAALSPLALGASVTFTSSNCSSYVLSGAPPNQTVTCVAGSGGGGGGSVPVCAPTANPPKPSVGTATTISANCNNAPTGYTWTGGPCPHAGASCTVAAPRATPVTFTIRATNATGTGAAASITITWQ
jgi:hypothetical protein